MQKHNGAASRLRAAVSALLDDNEFYRLSRRCTALDILEATQQVAIAGAANSRITRWLKAYIVCFCAEANALATTIDWACWLASQAERRDLPGSAVTLHNVANKIRSISGLIGMPGGPSRLSTPDGEIDAAYSCALNAVSAAEDAAEEAAERSHIAPEACLHARIVGGSPIRSLLRIGWQATLFRSGMRHEPELARDFQRAFLDIRARAEASAIGQWQEVLRLDPRCGRGAPALLPSKPARLSGASKPARRRRRG